MQARPARLGCGVARLQRLSILAPVSPSRGEEWPLIVKDRPFAGSRHVDHSACRRDHAMITRPAMMISSTNTNKISAAS